VLATDHREPAAAGAEADEDVHRELRWWWRDGGWPRRGLRERLAIERHDHEALGRHLAAHCPDVVAWWAMGGMPLSLVERVRRTGIPAVGFVHDDWLLYGPVEDQWLRLFAGRRRPLAPLAEALTRRPARAELAGAARWAFVSQATRRRAEDRLGPLPDATVASSGIDAAWLGRRTPEPPWRWRLLSVGRVDPRKGVEVAAAALAHLPGEARLVVAGPGEGAALPAGDRVEVLGPRTRDELPDVYADADVVVFPVLWDEPWGLVPLEAMALGRPVIATGRGGSAEYLRDGENCLLVPAGDAEALAAAVRRLAGDPALRARLREGGVDTAARHTDAAFHAEVERLLSEAAGARAARSGAR
jgi:glycosyltransferase involved in cell wall biosynthesis